MAEADRSEEGRLRDGIVPSSPSSSSDGSREGRIPVLVSACLLGRPVRYDGKVAGRPGEILRRWIREGRVVEVCPEIAGGLPTPRPPAEIADASGGGAVLRGEAAVRDASGEDLTRAFVLGAERILEEALRRGVRLAVLKEGSPSCGSGRTYDGSFSGRRVPLPGVTSALLERAGIRVFGEDRLDEAQRYLEELEVQCGSR